MAGETLHVTLEECASAFTGMIERVGWLPQVPQAPQVRIGLCGIDRARRQQARHIDRPWLEGHHQGEMIERVASKQDTVVIARQGPAIAVVAPLIPKTRKRRP